jgi:uncharacterized protein
MTAGFTTDKDGRLHAATCAISKAGVNRYRGREIPGWQKLGLDGDAVYRLLRDPDELRKAAPTFRGLPLLSEHVFTSARSLDPTLIVGTIGSDAKFEYPYLKNSVHVWARSAISGIESESRKALSAAYLFSADMTPGEFDGEKYDGVMRGIVGNHVALVPKTRAGVDVAIGAIALARRRDAARLHL